MERSSVNAGRPAARSAADGPHASAVGLWTADARAAADGATHGRAAADGATHGRAARVSVRPMPPRRTEVLLVPGDVSHDVSRDVSRDVFRRSLPPGRRERQSRERQSRESQTGAPPGSGPDRVRVTAESRLHRVCVVP